MPDVVVIQQNTRVRVADVNVGNVTKIEVQDWHALVTMRIDGDVHLPANSTAKVGQTSLLGSMHIELAPPTDEPPEGELKDGSVIPLSAASTYPTTEQTLASVSILLNGGGLGQLQEINQTFAKALAGRENDMRSLLTQLDTFIAQLNAQTDDIITATETSQLAGRSGRGERSDRRHGAHHDPAGAGRAGGFAREAGRRHRRAWASSAPSPPRRSIRPRNRWWTTCATSRRCSGSWPNAGPALTKGLDFLSTYPWVKSTIRQLVPR